MGYPLSVLQREAKSPVVGTLLRANKVVQHMKENEDFEHAFQPLGLDSIGFVEASDAALGNVTLEGHVVATPLERFASRAATLLDR